MQTTRVRPPRALSNESLWATGIGTLALTVALAGDAIRNLLTIWGFGVVCVLVAGACVAVMVVLRPRIDPRRLPKALVGFVGLAIVSLAWSAYPDGTAVTLCGMALASIVGVYVATVLSWAQFLRSLSMAIKWVLGLSLLFELWVAVVVRHPVLPLWRVFGEDPPLLDMWSRNLLFEGGQIQGIPGNSNLLGIVATLGIVVFGIQLAIPRGRLQPTSRNWSIFWLAVAVVEFALTRSSTMIAAALVAAAALGAAVLARRAHDQTARRPIYLGMLALLVAGVAIVVFAGGRILDLLGKSSDLTGRTEIWATVWNQIVQRPWFGWGYSSPWAPWVEPLGGLVTRNGVQQLQAHNAWLDVWMQLGIVGLVLFASAVIATLGRAWFRAVDRPRFDLVADRPYEPISLFPLLVMVVLVVQSLAESRILMESGWVLLVALALSTKQREIVALDQEPDLDDRRRTPAAAPGVAGA